MIESIHGFLHAKNWMIGLALLISCQSAELNNKPISKDEMTKIVKDLDNQFSVGVRKKDSAILADIYSDSAQYVQPGKPIITGKAAIGKYWAGFIKLKENPVDLIINIQDVRSNNELMYE